MSEGTPDTVMVEANHIQGLQRRRSPRFGSPGALRETETKMALGEKRSITVRKIAPRKTTALSGNNKENTPKRSRNLQETKVSTPEAGPNRRTPTTSSAGKKEQRQPAVPSPGLPSSSAGRKERQPAVPSPGLPSSSAGRKRQQPAVPSPGLPSSSAGRKRQQPAVPSPILPSSPPASSQPTHQQDSVWTRKVRRSYSRLSDSSLHSPGNRETLFGFGKLNTPEVVRSRAEPSRSPLQVSGSFVSMLEAGECCPEQDPNIPGVTVVKEKRRRRKVQQINTEELEVLAAQMNAEFREAEEFELVVE